jgi:outer membrane receptor protein involved in Fe transport
VPSDSLVRQGDVKADYVRPLPGKAKLKAGYELELDANDYDNFGYQGLSASAAAPDPNLTNRFLYRQTLNQGYVTLEEPIGKLTVLAGLRLEDVRLDLTQVTQGFKDTPGYLGVYPSLHLGWQLDERQKLTASYSHRVTRPAPQDLNAFRVTVDPLNFRAGNPLLKPQETHSIELGYEYRKAPATYLVTFYYRDVYDDFTDVVQGIGGGQFLTTRSNLGRRKRVGVELNANGRLAPRLTYNVSANLLWTELDPAGTAFAARRQGGTAFGQGNINWQVTAKDFVQIQGFVNGHRLTAQGYAKTQGMVSGGWRHKFSDKVSGLIQVQDIAALNRDTQVIDTPTLKAETRRRSDSRLFIVGLVWNFGGGRQRDPAFDFGGGGPGG